MQENKALGPEARRVGAIFTGSQPPFGRLDLHKEAAQSKKEKPKRPVDDRRPGQHCTPRLRQRNGGILTLGYRALEGAAVCKKTNFQFATARARQGPCIYLCSVHVCIYVVCMCMYVDVYIYIYRCTCTCIHTKACWA